jgi:tripartite ATP-independent transporter DctM subunit
MSWSDLAIIYSLVLCGCLIGGVYIGAAMGIAGLVGVALVFGTTLWQSVGDIAWNTSTNFGLVAIPLFILMGEIVLQGGIASRFYTGLAPLFRRVPGGLAQTNIAGCAVFSAVCGSSVATAMTVGSIALKEMRTRGYKDSLTIGTLTAGGGLGILIPPSIPMIVYASMTNESILQLFMAGVIPGLLLATFYALFVGVRATLDPSLVPSGEQTAVGVEGSVVRDALPVILLVGGVILGMYAGVVTPTEASALGVLLATLISWYYGSLHKDAVKRALSNTVTSSAVIMFITICAQILQYGIVVTGFGKDVTAAVIALDLSPLAFFCILVVIYTLLGMFMDGLSMMLVTVPLIYAPMIAMGFDGVWLGILLIVFIELGAITPPVGLNLFAIQSISPQTKLAPIAWSSAPYCLIIVGFAYLCYAFPQIVLWLPATMR